MQVFFETTDFDFIPYTLTGFDIIKLNKISGIHVDFPFTITTEIFGRGFRTFSDPVFIKSWRLIENKYRQSVGYDSPITIMIPGKNIPYTFILKRD